MRKVVVLAVFIVGGFGGALDAHAEEHSGFYVGGSVGEAKNELGEFSGRDIAFKLTGGYAFNQHLGIEVAYIDTGTQDDTVGLTRIENESSGVIASALLRAPLGETFAIFGKVGYAFYESDATARLGNLSVRESDSDEDVVYGVGIELAITTGLRFRAEYEVVDVDEGDFQIVSAGAVYKF